MADNVKVRLLRPLDGNAIGSEMEFSPADAKRLEGFGAVEIVGQGKAPSSKAEPAAPANKAERAAPANKAAKNKDS